MFRHTNGHVINKCHGASIACFDGKRLVGECENRMKEYGRLHLHGFLKIHQLLRIFFGILRISHTTHAYYVLPNLSVKHLTWYHWSFEANYVRLWHINQSQIIYIWKKPTHPISTLLPHCWTIACFCQGWHQFCHARTNSSTSLRCQHIVWPR